uniref:Coronin n=1 Tax=Ciona savignyi TaxID=51511 RepID=H2YQS9_CIOSA
TSNMSRVVRQSKYRHVFGTNLKQDACYTAINTNKNSANGTFCAVNPKFIAFSINSTGGGAFQVLPLTQTGRMSPKQPSFNAHKTAVLTLEFSPFNDNLLATCADNGEVMLWEIPDEGIKENQDEPLATLQKHKKRVNLLKWNPVADNILISAGSENFICVWNTETGELIYEIPLPDSLFDVCWNHNGTEIATTCRDKALRVYDVRSQELLHEKEKCCGSSTFMTCNYVLKNKLFLTAKVAGAKQYFLFDLKNLDVPLETDELPGDSGYSFPFYDEASSVMFVTTKGQSAIPYYEIVDEEPYVHYISTHSAPTSQQGMAWLPKRALDLKSVEIAKFFKVTKDKIEPISMRVPRK